MVESPALQLQLMLGRLGGIGAPAIVMHLCTLMFLNLGPIDMNLDACEYFARSRQSLSSLTKLAFIGPLQTTFSAFMENIIVLLGSNCLHA